MAAYKYKWLATAAYIEHLQAKIKALAESHPSDTVDGPVATPSSFGADLAAVLNKHNAESGSDTPDFVLADFLADCLRAFDVAIGQRKMWYGQPQDEKPRAVGYNPPPVEPQPVNTTLPLVDTFDFGEYTFRRDAVTCVTPVRDNKQYGRHYTVWFAEASEEHGITMDDVQHPRAEFIKAWRGE